MKEKKKCNQNKLKKAMAIAIGLNLDKAGNLIVTFNFTFMLHFEVHAPNDYNKSS